MDTGSNLRSLQKTSMLCTQFRVVLLLFFSIVRNPESAGQAKIASSEAHRLLDEAVGTVSCLGLFADQKGRAEERAGKARKILKCEWKSKTYNGNEISGEIKKRWISHGNQQINEMVQKENTALENAQLDDNYTPELSDESADEAMWL